MKNVLKISENIDKEGAIALAIFQIASVIVLLFFEVFETEFYV